MAVTLSSLARGDGKPVAALWRQLWLDHEGWRGYPAARGDEVYEALARRLEGWAHDSAGDPVRGAHLHLVARNEAGLAVGQVEGWLERFGEHPRTPTTCELRSLFVAAEARGQGIGAQLVVALQQLARRVVRGGLFMVAEVLAPNPAFGFYRALGYRPIAQHCMVPVAIQPSPRARLARTTDTWAVARLELLRRQELRNRGDVRLDPPGALEAGFLSTVAKHLRQTSAVELVAERDGQVEVAGAFSSSVLEAPFAPVVRAVLSRWSSRELPRSGALLDAARTLAAQRGAARLEVQDCPVGPLAPVLAERGAFSFSHLVARHVE